MQSISPAFMAATAASTPGTATNVAFGAVVRGPESRGICNTADANPRCVGVIDVCKPGPGRDKICALQQMIGVAEIDEFFPLLVNRHERDVPFSACRRV